ncbi:MAG: carbon-nitrogen hydrolase family protein [Myxococcales bacterium]|nr:carbon-nitrogen hydrolase family protein [Myxococcales bacterium]
MTRSHDTLALAVAQTVPVAGDVAANLEAHVALASMAADEGAELVLFAELSLTGYELERAAELAFFPDDARLHALRQLARARALTIVAGAPLRVDGALAIAALAFAPDGSTAIYTKRHLGAFAAADNPGGPVPPAEASVFSAGRRDPLLPLAGGAMAALAICADVGRAEHGSAAAARGASVYLASMFVIPSDLARDRARLRQRSREHEMVVAFANYGGPSGGLPAAGCSAIYSERGELLGELASGGAGVGVALARRGAGATGWTFVRC